MIDRTPFVVQLIASKAPSRQQLYCFLKNVSAVWRSKTEETLVLLKGPCLYIRLSAGHCQLTYR